MSLKGSMPSASMILRRNAVRAPDREFLAKAPTHKRGRECLSRSIGRQAGEGALDRVVVCFAHDYLAQDDSARHATRRAIASWVNSGWPRPGVFLPAPLLPLTDRPRPWLAVGLLPGC